MSSVSPTSVRPRIKALGTTCYYFEKNNYMATCTHTHIYKHLHVVWENGELVIQRFEHHAGHVVSRAPQGANEVRAAARPNEERVSSKGLRRRRGGGSGAGQAEVNESENTSGLKQSEVSVVKIETETQ